MERNRQEIENAIDRLNTFVHNYHKIENIIKEEQEYIDKAIVNLNTFVHSYYDVKDIIEKEQEYIDKAKELIEKYKIELKELENFNFKNIIILQIENIQVEVYLLQKLSLNDYTLESFGLSYEQIQSLFNGVFDIVNSDFIEWQKIYYYDKKENVTVFINVTDFLTLYNYFKNHKDFNDSSAIITLHYLFELAQKAFTANHYKRIKTL